MSNANDTPARLRATLGPVLAGGIGGLGVGVSGLAVLDNVCRNALATYAKFPSLTPPPLPFLGLPGWAIVGLVVLGCGVLFTSGALAARLARGRDAVDDLAAGITAALVAALTALATGGGAVLVIACVVVPSISDLTLLSGELPAAGAEPTHPLVDRYPDLGAASAKERGPLMMSKVVSDQISGSVRAGWIAGASALLGAGAPVLAGTLAGGHLWRRQYRLRTAALTYLELTVVSALTIAFAGGVVLNPTGMELAGGMGTLFAALAVLGLVAAAALSATAALNHWPTTARVGLILVWAAVVPLAPAGTVWWPGAAIAIALLVVAWVRLHRSHTEPSGRVELTGAG